MLQVSEKSHSSGCFGVSEDRFSQFSVSSDDGVVATDNSICSKVGATILQRGGNAVDAAISSAFCLGVINPASSGIGGGCYILLYNATSGNSVFIDSREYAPSNSHKDMFVSDPMLAQDGGLAIAIMGETKGLYEAYLNHGSGNISWYDLVAPAAEMAKDWIVSPLLEVELNEISSQLKSKKFPLLNSLYLRADGSHKRTGDHVYQPLLSETLYHIASEGPDYLYKTMAATIASEIQENGGIVTADDISSYSVHKSKPIHSSIFGHEYLGVGGSSSGGAVIAGILEFMNGYSQPLVSQGGKQ